ncbi:alpha/beta hydrolase [Sporosarcina sp. ACRSL]|uniref:alpha/beta fold hydrolase n=1 Tax=Sporosarcina sp. ACRSL TaxID=2918215 RepID=UPI001EF58ED2|nr:alpha/beta hydrolase [Sporosarcina sp. ACRSL]MCG7342630.1 alpha/beta hydrolase [Sporosarcina sp. ACRSL]
MVLVLLVLLLVVIGGLYTYNKSQVKKAEELYPPNGEFVTVDNCSLHYISEGSGNPIVFLHGGILSSSDFKEVVQLAAKQGYHALAFDRPGYGYSDRPRHVEVTPIDQAKIIHSAIKQLGVDKPIILVGHSWSGTMTLSYALQFPNEVAGIVLLGPAKYKEGYPAENGDPLSKMITTPILGDLMVKTLLKTPLGKRISNSMVKATFTPELPPEGYKEEVFAIGFRPRHFKANREDVLAFPGTSKQLSEKYKEIKTPIKIVVGEKDPFGTIEQAQRLKRDIPHATYTLIPNVGHMIPELHPKLVMDYVDDIYTQSTKTLSPEYI